MNDNEIIRMVNQIADFFEPYPRDEAIAGISEHITSFWEPRMRAKLKFEIEQGAGEISELAIAGSRKALGLN